MNTRSAHTVIIGSKGCGKSERARKLMGLTPQQYQEECEKFDRFVSDEQQKQKLQNGELFKSIMMSYYEGLNIY